MLRMPSAAALKDLFLAAPFPAVCFELLTWAPARERCPSSAPGSAGDGHRPVLGLL